jgi:hypothetical protein
VLFRPDKLSLVGHAFITDRYDGKEMSAGLELRFEVKGSLELLRVFVVHWPSRMFLPASHKRHSLAESLQRRIDGWPENVPLAGTVVLGDFNEEPFDAALSHALLGSRDRSLVRSKRARLYNPFWALLGERQALEEEGDGVVRLAAGTYHYGSSPHTRWHTFDQVLVSASLLEGAEWRLVERATRVWQAPPLVNERGRPVGGFDHLPVATVLANMRQQTNTTTETP